jgi:hypothetical protein
MVKRSCGKLSDTRELLESSAHGLEVLGTAEDDEDRVVTRECAYDFGPFLPIERHGDRLCPTREGFEKQQVAHAVRAEVESGEQAAQRRGWVGNVGRDHISRTSLFVGDLDQSKFADIPGERGLGDVDITRREELSQDFLGGHAVIANDVEDRGVALWLDHREAGGRCRAGMASALGMIDTLGLCGKPGTGDQFCGS